MKKNLLQLNIKFRTRIKYGEKRKIIKNDNDELVVKNYPKNKHPIIQQQKFNLPNYPSCKRHNWLEFDKGYYCKKCKFIINKQKHQIGGKVLRQERDIPTRLNFANKKIREIFINMVITNYIS